MLQIYGYTITMKIHKLYLLLLITSISICQSELTINDIESWNSVEFKYNRINNTEFSFESGYRIHNNLTSISKKITNFSVKQQLNQNVHCAIGSRYDTRKKNNQLEDRLRFYFDCFFNYNIYKNVKIKSRTRYQFQNTFSDLSMDDPNKVYRHKITFDHKMKNNKTNVYFGSELFYQFSSGFEKFRLITGLKKKIEKNVVISLSGMIQSEINSNYNSFALRMKLVYSI